MAFPQVVGSATSSRTSNAIDDSVTLPGSIAAGDLILVFHCSDGPLTRTFPSPWVEIKDIGVAGDSATIGIAYLIASGGEASVTVTKSVTERFSALAIQISASSWHGTTPPEVSTGVTGTSTAPDPDAITPSWGRGDNLFIAVCAFENNAGGISITVFPTNYGSNNLSSPDILSAGRGGIGTRELAAGSDDPGAFTISSSDAWWAGTVVVPPTGGFTNPMHDGFFVG